MYTAKQTALLNDWTIVGNELEKISRKPPWSILMYYLGNCLEELWKIAKNLI
jgi:hypothetical protein